MEVYFCNFSRVTSRGEATKIDEYVPVMMPIRRTKAKSFVVVPPRKYSATRARKIVRDVLIERPNVCVTELPTISAKDCFDLESWLRRKFSRTRSKTTIVSCTE